MQRQDTQKISRWLLLPTAILTGWIAYSSGESLRSGRICKPDNNAIPIQIDEWTKLLTYPDHHPDKLPPDQEAIRSALAYMERPESHCAMRRIGAVLQGKDTTPLLQRRGRPVIVFGTPRDPHAEYDPTTNTITVNKDKDYLRDPENLAKSLHHEGMHDVEMALGLRGANEAINYHDSSRIYPIMLHLFNNDPNDPCMLMIDKKNGTLLAKDGTPFESDYLTAQKDSSESSSCAPVSAYGHERFAPAPPRLSDIMRDMHPSGLEPNLKDFENSSVPPALIPAGPVSPTAKPKNNTDPPQQ